MKGIFKFLLLCCVLGESCSKPIGNPEPDYDITGSWYNETLNEEITFSANGTFKSTISNLFVSEQIIGNYKVKGKVLEETFLSNDSTYTRSWDITSAKNGELTLSSTTEHSTFYCISELVRLHAFEDCHTFDLPANSQYKSLDERIARIKDGRIYAFGMKGITYIQIKNEKETSFIKVVVDVSDDFWDYWYDYSKVLRLTYPEMKETLGRPNSTIREEAAYYTDMSARSDLIKEVSIFFNNQVVRQIILSFNNKISDDEILNYLSSKFYKGQFLIGGYFHFTIPDEEENRIKKEYCWIIYEPETKKVYYQTYK